MTITIRVKQILAYAALAILAIAVGFYVYWSLQPSEVLVVNNSPVPVQPPEVRDGGKVYLTIDFCKKSGAHGTTTLNLIGETVGAKIAIAWPVDTTPEQCQVYPEIPVPIPAQTPTDMYHAEFVTCYDVNPLKRSCTTFTSRSFKVTNNKLNPGDATVQEQR